MLAFRLLLLAAVAVLASCGAAVSPEQQVRRVLKQIESAVDSRETSDLVQYDFKLTLRQEPGEWKLSFAEWRELPKTRAQQQGQGFAPH